MTTTKKITIVVPGEVHEDLSEWADGEKRPLANLVSFLVEQTLRAKYPSKYPPPVRVDGTGTLPPEELVDQVKKFISLLLGERDRNGISYVLLGQALGFDPEDLHNLYLLLKECKKEKSIK